MINGGIRASSSPDLEDDGTSWVTGDIPIQLLSIARMLRPSYSVQVLLGEQGETQSTPQQLFQEISEKLSDCLFFGITAMTGYGIEEALELAQMVREACPDCRIVWGGWHASLLPEQTLDHELVDFVVRGQGEMTVIALAQALEAGVEDFSRIPGLGWKRRGKPIINARRAPADINSFPPLPFSLVDDMLAFAEIVGYLSSTGCPSRCAFCADASTHKGNWNGLTVERVDVELGLLSEKYGIRNVCFWDSNFFADWQRAMTILRSLRNRGMRAAWAFGRIIDLQKACSEDLRLIHQTVGTVLVGAESGNEAALRLMRKPLDRELILAVAKTYFLHDIPLSFSTMVGLPFGSQAQSESELFDTTALIDDILTCTNGFHTARIQLFTPFPATPLFERAKTCGFTPPERLADWSDFDTISAYIPNLPHGLREMTDLISQHLIPCHRKKLQAAKGSADETERELTALCLQSWRNSRGSGHVGKEGK
jgi:radical SAM superfamily enzyme YgiQ (UPF0313 family)